MSFQDWLREHEACTAAKEWVGTRTAEEAYEACEKPYWLAWFAAHTNAPKSVLVDALREALLVNKCSDDVKALLNNLPEKKISDTAVKNLYKKFCLEDSWQGMSARVLVAFTQSEHHNDASTVMSFAGGSTDAAMCDAFRAVLPFDALGSF